MLAPSQILCWAPASIHLTPRASLQRGQYFPLLRWGNRHREAELLQPKYWVTPEVGHTDKARAPWPTTWALTHHLSHVIWSTLFTSNYLNIRPPLHLSTLLGRCVRVNDDKDSLCLKSQESKFPVVVCCHSYQRQHYKMGLF